MSRTSAHRPDYPRTLDGHCVVVTGAGRGLGQQMALAVALAGARVIGVARTRTELDDTAALVDAGGATGRFVSLVGDVTSPRTRADCLAAVDAEALQAVDVVHAAGAQVRKPAHEVSRDDWERVIDINLTAPFFLSGTLGSYALERQLRGSHVFVGSLTSHLGLEQMAPYAATKSGLLGVVRSLAVEWARRGLRVNALCPGYFRTALTAPVFDDPDRRRWIESRIPMGRPGDAADLAGPAVFLLSDASSYVTGQALNVDGGWTSG